MNYHLDLHTHSIISHDGGIKDFQYRQLLADPKNYIAITDHNKVAFAQKLHAELGDRIIVGEEIMTNRGEIIGLFLTDLIQPKLSPEETIRQIRAQNALVYIPHPLEKSRRGLPLDVLENIFSDIDILEIFNARTLEPWLVPRVADFLTRHPMITAASSDAHSIGGFGTAYSVIDQIPTRENLLATIKNAQLTKAYPPFLSRFAPGVNKLKKVFIR